jgi:hypothetical protein
MELTIIELIEFSEHKYGFEGLRTLLAIDLQLQ